MSNRHKRLAIPHTIQCELWARAAGRCEFRGCNALLYKDELTQHRSNVGIISHIVAHSPDGPRGDAVRSALLAKDIRNLILTCRKHGKMIDDTAHVATYSEAVLMTYKHEHEQRIRLATANGEQVQTHVLILQVAIDSQDIVINPADVHRAIQPKYPVQEHPTIIDLSGARMPAEGKEFFTTMAQSITQQIEGFLARQAGVARAHSLSVFAIAPIPLLIHAGQCLGDVQRIDLYQRHRDTQDWMWKEDEAACVFYETIKPTPMLLTSDKPIALLFSISGLVSHEQVMQALSAAPAIYEIRAREVSRDFLRSRKRLGVFGYEMRRLLVDMYEVHHQRIPVHVFAALPAPMAVEFGRTIKSLDTPFIIYEYENTKHAYMPALEISQD